MKKLFAFVIIFFVGVACGLILTHGSLQAQNLDTDAVISKLNEVLKGQQDAITAINSLKDDIQIIKVRVTQLQ